MSPAAKRQQSQKSHAKGHQPQCNSPPLTVEGGDDASRQLSLALHPFISCQTSMFAHLREPRHHNQPPSRVHPCHEICKAGGSPLHLQCTQTAEHGAILEPAFPLWREIKACLLYSLSHTVSHITNLFNWWITGLHITFVGFMCHRESNRKMKASFLGQIKAMVREGLDFFNTKDCSKIVENRLNEFEALGPQEGSQSMKLLKRARN